MFETASLSLTMTSSSLPRVSVRKLTLLFPNVGTKGDLQGREICKGGSSTNGIPHLKKSFPMLPSIGLQKNDAYASTAFLHFDTLMTFYCVSHSEIILEFQI